MDFFTSSAPVASDAISLADINTYGAQNMADFASNEGDLFLGMDTISDGANMMNNNSLWGNAGNFMTSDQGSNAFDMATKGYGLWNQKKMQDYQKGMMNKQENRASDAYNRDKETAQRRQQLRF